MFGSRIDTLFFGKLVLLGTAGAWLGEEMEGGVLMIGVGVRVSYWSEHLEDSKSEVGVCVEET
jgi:hypothetical protein